MKLTSMTDFVLKESCNKDRNSIDNLNTIFRYALFLKQPLELWMFVPCAVDGEVLEEPEPHYTTSSFDDCPEPCFDEKECEIYKQAKERVLFFSQHGENELFDICLDEFFNIEQLANEISDIELTPTAIKKIGL